jgi:hypothetical protein
MNSRDFKKAFHLALLDCGFLKEGGLYYKRSDEVIGVIGLQKSNYEESYYANVGYMIKEFHPDVDAPRDIDGDVRTRFSVTIQGKEMDCLDPGMFSSDDEVRSVVCQNVTRLVEGSLSIRGLKTLLTKNPILLYQTTLPAKQRLDFE